MVSPLNLFADGLKQYVVAPLNAFGLGGFVFDVEGDTTINLSTEITDHYLEDNSSVQDHIAIRPKRVILRRYVGELVDTQDQGGIQSTVQSTVQKLTALSSFLPVLSKGAEQIFSLKASDITFNKLKDTISSQTVNQLTDYYSFGKNLLGAQNSRQQQAYLYLKSLMEQRILVSLQTPFEFINNMAIESIVGIQPEGSAYISDFTIVLKQIRFAQLISQPAGTVSNSTSGANSRGDVDGQVSGTGSTTTPAADQAEPPVLQGKAAVQYEPIQNNGVVAGTAKTFPTNDSQWSKLQPGLLAPPRSK